MVLDPRNFTEALRRERHEQGGHPVGSGELALESLGAVFPLVYRELKAIAHHQLGKFPYQSLDTTGLVHEAYLKMVDQDISTARDRAHFLAISARAMRQVLVAAARSRSRIKRGEGRRPLPLLDDEMASGDESPAAGLDDILAVHQAIGRLERLDQRLASLVEGRFFGGMTIQELALQLDVSTATVERDWRRARAWLRRYLDEASEA